MKKTILLVNQDLAVRRMISRLLTGEGYHVLIGQEEGVFCNFTFRDDVDLILLDSDVPDEQVRGIIKALGPADSVPSAIILSNRADPVVCSGLRISAVMEKPLDPEKLLGIIRDLLPDHAPVQAPQTGPSLALIKPAATQAKCLH